jgi:diguanylate cyclase (GGDEF)-like protein/PAS domain S-box-containing protein
LLRDRDDKITGVISTGIDVTNRKREEDSLNSEFRQLLSVYESIDEPIYVADPETYELLFANKSLLSSFGSIVGKKCYKALQGSDSPCYFCTNKHIFGKNLGKTHVWQFNNTKNNKWYHCIDKAIAWTDGRMVRCEVAIDITERVMIQDELKKSQARYQEIMESQKEFLCRFLPDYTLTFANEALCNLMGKSHEELLGQKFIKFLCKEDQKKVIEAIQGINFDNPSEMHEEKILMKNGETRWLEWSNRAIFDKNNNIIEYQSVGRDITERRLSEERVKEKERFTSEIFSSIQDGISILDNNLNVIRVNPIIERWYDHAMPIVGRKCYEVYHGFNKPCDICPVAKTLKTGEQCHGIVAKRGNNGEVVGWLDLYSFPLRDASTNKIKGVIEYVRDVTERKNSEKEKDNLNKELVKSNRKLLRMAMKDHQTGLYNHRYFEEIIEAEFYRAKRHGQPLSMIMLDIDYFKSINDVYGHPFGDVVLRQFAKKIRRLVRLHDYVIRYGGEEFVVILPGIDKPGASIMARRVIEKIRLYNFGDKKTPVKLKVSISLVSFPEDRIFKSMDLIEVADKILNRTKDLGGDRVGTYDDIVNGNKKTSKEPDVGHLKQKLYRLTKRANQALIESVYAFAKTIELKDHFTGDHVEKTVYYATETAKNLGLMEQDLLLVEQAAILHDLGKIGISDNILLKEGKLTDEEFEHIKEHPKIGADIIRPIQFLRGLIPLILYHHERWDGRGYPCGLKGEEIPVGARVIAIADVYQALTSDRPYRKAFSKEKAIDMIKNSSGSQFDPKIVKAFLVTVSGRG